MMPPPCAFTALPSVSLNAMPGGSGGETSVVLIGSVRIPTSDPAATAQLVVPPEPAAPLASPSPPEPPLVPPLVPPDTPPLPAIPLAPAPPVAPALAMPLLAVVPPPSAPTRLPRPVDASPEPAAPDTASPAESPEPCVPQATNAPQPTERMSERPCFWRCIIRFSVSRRSGTAFFGPQTRTARARAHIAHMLMPILRSNDHASPRMRPRAMTICWICVVPSYRRKRRTSR